MLEGVHSLHSASKSSLKALDSGKTTPPSFGQCPNVNFFVFFVRASLYPFHALFVSQSCQVDQCSVAPCCPLLGNQNRRDCSRSHPARNLRWWRLEPVWTGSPSQPRPGSCRSYRSNISHLSMTLIFNRPGVAGAVL